MTNNSRDLTERHREILFLVCKGFRNPEIAERLGLSSRTVKSNVSHLLAVYEVSNRTELAGLVGEERGTSSGK